MRSALLAGLVIVGAVLFALLGRDYPPGEGQPGTPATSASKARTARDRLEAVLARLAAARPPRPAAVAGGADPPAEAVEDETMRRERAFAGDPVGIQVPLLGDQPPERQLEVLAWMRGLEPERLAAAMPAVLEAQALSADERGAAAVQLREALIAQLEADGVVAAEPATGVAIVEVVDDHDPPPLPPELLDDYNPHPDDPAGAELLRRSMR